MQAFELSGYEVLLWRKKQLAKGGRKEDLDWLLDIGGGLTWGSLQKLLVDHNRTVFITQSLEMLESIWQKHLLENTPLQYLIGRCPWRDIELEVDPSVLIPRQETELLVDFGLQKIGRKNFGHWADLGTGSGAIAVALARSLPAWSGHAVDCSLEALKLAERNLNRLANNSNWQTHLGSWWRPLKEWSGAFDLVLVNPPYIPESILNDLDPLVRDHEPRLALCGGEDGLSCCREVISGSRIGLAPKGWLMLEHHYDQSDAVLNLMRKYGLIEVSSEVDLQGIRRFAIGRNP